MKRMACLVVLAILGGAVLAGDTVTSVNVVGYVKVTIPASPTMAFVGLNFASMDTGGDGGMTALELFGTNQLIKNNTTRNADKVYAWRSDMGSGGGYLKLYQRANGEFWTVAPPTSFKTNPVFRTGDGFWIVPANAAAEHTITIMGNVPLADSVTVGMPVGLTQLANPYPTDWDLNGTNVDWQASNARANNTSRNADQVWIWQNGNYEKKYYLRANYRWTRVGGTETNGAIIRVGEGAWYIAKGGFTNTFLRPFGID